MDERKKWIEVNHPVLSVRQQCKILELNRSSVYYTPRQKTFSKEQLALLRLVDEIYTKYPFFGTRQMSSYISLHNHPCERHEIRDGHTKNWDYNQPHQDHILANHIQSIKFILIYCMELILCGPAKFSAQILPIFGYNVVLFI